MLAAVLLAAAVSAPWWGGALLRRSSYFAVRQVEVVGARYLAPAEVTRRLGLSDADANVWVDLDRVEEAVRRIPGVAEASVSRRLPGTLVVRVREQEPVALADGPAGLVAVAEDGTPLPYEVAGGAVDAPLIARPDGRLTRGLAVVRSNDPALFARVSAATLEPLGGLTVHVAEGRIRLDVPVDAGTVRAMAAVRRDLAARGIAWREVDGRFRGWVVVRPAATLEGTD